VDLIQVVEDIDTLENNSKNNIFYQWNFVSHSAANMFNIV